MIYVKQTWEDDNPLYPTSAARMGHIEDGIYDTAVALTTVQDLLTAGLPAANIANGSITNAKLATPTMGVYRTLLNVVSGTPLDQTAATHVMRDITTTQLASANSTANVNSGLYLDDADYNVTGGPVPKLRLRATCLPNATAPAITFTFGLYPVTVAGAADTLTMTLGTVVTGSTVAIASPPASTVTPGVGTDFTFPADGYYVLGVVYSGTLANNSTVNMQCALQLHHV